MVIATFFIQIFNSLIIALIQIVYLTFFSILQFALIKYASWIVSGFSHPYPWSDHSVPNEFPIMKKNSSLSAELLQPTMSTLWQFVFTFPIGPLHMVPFLSASKEWSAFIAEKWKWLDFIFTYFQNLQIIVGILVRTMLFLILATNSASELSIVSNSRPLAQRHESIPFWFRMYGLLHVSSSSVSRSCLPSEYSYRSQIPLLKMSLK